MLATKSVLLTTLFFFLLLDVIHAIRPIIHKRRHRSSLRRSATGKNSARRLFRVRNTSSNHRGDAPAIAAARSKVASAMVTITSSKMNSGTGTSFIDGRGACGRTNSGSDLIVALSRDLFAAPADSNTSFACGRRILATGPKGAVIVTVADQCQTCDKFDLDFSQRAFERIADPAAGRVFVEWSFLD